MGTLTDVHLVIRLCVSDALKLELLQGLGELLHGYRKVCKSKSTSIRTERANGHSRQADAIHVENSKPSAAEQHSNTTGLD